MSGEKLSSLERANRWLQRLAESLTRPTAPFLGEALYAGVDLGTADVVMVVLDRDCLPVIGRLRWTGVVREGLVFDFAGAVQVVRELKAEIESLLHRPLEFAATGIPPGITGRDALVPHYVLEEAGLQVTGIVDEPTAAALALGLTEGAVVDIGGGTTGISVLEGGRVVYTADEPTGGRHLTLVLEGRYGLNFEEAERLKRERGMTPEIQDTLRPVLEKMASIVQRHLRGRTVRTLYLAGGTCDFPGIESVMEEIVGIPVVKPTHPLLVTPLGLALSCYQTLQVTANPPNH